MRHSLEVGFSFGISSAIITTLALMVGLFSGTHSRLAVIGGILLIAISDALADSFAIHLSEETEAGRTKRQVWEATFGALFSKFVVASSFLVPVLLLELKTAIVASVVWGIAIILSLSCILAKKNKERASGVMLSHAGITITIITISYFVGQWVAAVFG